MSYLIFTMSPFCVYFHYYLGLHAMCLTSLTAYLDDIKVFRFDLMIVLPKRHSSQESQISIFPVSHAHRVIPEVTDILGDRLRSLLCERKYKYKMYEHEICI